MNKETGGPAFPHDRQDDYTGGMTLRDYFAAKAMAAIIASIKDYHELRRQLEEDGYTVEQFVAKRAYQQADAMLAAMGEL